jgi:hypothetical protein
METLTAVAAALGVPRYQIIAAMDGDAVLPLDDAGRDVLRAEIEAALDERLGPHPPARGSSGAG